MTSETKLPPAYGQGQAQPQPGDYPPQQGYGQPGVAPPGSYPPQQGYGQPGVAPGGYPPQATYNPQGVAVMTAPTTTVITRQPGMQPEDHLILAIFVTICCCLPLGIIGIVKAMDVRSKWAAGDVAGAEEASRDAKKFSMIGLILGIVLEVIGVVIIIIYFVVIVAAVTSTTTYYG